MAVCQLPAKHRPDSLLSDCFPWRPQSACHHRKEQASITKSEKKKNDGNITFCISLTLSLYNMRVCNVEHYRLACTQIVLANSEFQRIRILSHTEASVYGLVCVNTIICD